MGVARVAQRREEAKGNFGRAGCRSGFIPDVSGIPPSPGYGETRKPDTQLHTARPASFAKATNPKEAALHLKADAGRADPRRVSGIKPDLQWAGTKAEGGDGVVAAEQGEGTAFGGAHPAFLGGLEVVEAREVQPTVDKIKGEFGGETEAAFAGDAGGHVDGDADLPSEAGRRVALESDHVGGGGVGHEIGVEASEGGVGEKNEGELPRRAGPRDFRFWIFAL
jgi:hypothetical protein